VRYGLATACLLAATTLFADEPPRYEIWTTGPAVGEPRLLDNEGWFAHLFAAQTESPSDRAVPRTLGPQETAPQVRPRLDPRDDSVSPPAAPDIGRTDERRVTSSRRSRSLASFARRRRRIAVLGDSLIDTGQLNLQFTVLNKSLWPPVPYATAATASTDIPLTAAATRRRISKNSSVLPSDRLIFSYQHFHNALAVESVHPVTGGSRRVLNLDRMTIGFEKTFFNGRSSIDVRLPVNSRFDVATTDLELSNGRLGNASLLLKHLYFESDTISLGIGLGIDAPTGSDGHVVLPNTEVVIGNDAFHALPYLGLLFTPTDNFVVQAFAQVDIPLNGNEIEIMTPSSGSIYGTFDERELLFLSLSAAHWLFQDPDAAHLNGLAALLELHYSTSLDDGGRVTLVAVTDSYDLRDPSGVYQNLNMATGMQAQVGMTEFRAAVVLPLLDGNRPFDAEFLFQVNRRY